MSKGSCAAHFKKKFSRIFLDALLTHRTTAPTGAYPLPKPNI